MSTPLVNFIGMLHGAFLSNFEVTENALPATRCPIFDHTINKSSDMTTKQENVFPFG